MDCSQNKNNKNKGFVKNVTVKNVENQVFKPHTPLKLPNLFPLLFHNSIATCSNQIETRRQI